MEKFLENGKYSFYVVEKKDIVLNNEEVKEIEKEKIDDDFYDLYFFDNEKIIEEYCYGDGSCNLYRSIDDNNLAILYEEEYAKDVNANVISIYTPEYAYTAIKENGFFKNVSVIDQKDFKALANVVRSEFLSNIFARKHAKFLMYDFSPCTGSKNNVLLEDFKKRYIKYKATSSFIPVKSIVDDMKILASTYISTQNMNEKELFDKYQKLFNFQEFCPSTIEALAPMIDSPSTADYNAIFKKVNKNMRNVDKLIDMYLSEELEDETQNQNQKDRGIEL